MNPSRPAFRFRPFTSVLILGCFVLLILSGGVLFLAPPGRVANWTNWTMLGLTKHDWGDVHIWFGALFLAGGLAHLFFNWRPLVSYFKNRVARPTGFRWEWVAAGLLCLGVYAGTRARIAPFSTLLAWSEDLRESWDETTIRAPIPHAELLTLAELAKEAEVTLDQARERLAARGLQDASPDTVVRDLAAQAGLAPRQIFNAIQGQTDEHANNQAGDRGPGFGNGNGGGGRGNGAGGGAGGGPGWKSLERLCADEGLDLQSVVARLKDRGIEASPDQTLREIAAQGGFRRPVELLNAIREN